MKINILQAGNRFLADDRFSSQSDPDRLIFQRNHPLVVMPREEGMRSNDLEEIPGPLA